MYWHEVSNHFFRLYTSADQNAISLAYAELYISLATIFRRFRLELYETTRRDVDAKVDYFIPKPESGGQGVRVLVK